MKRIFLSSPVGGAGCTTLSVNLAYSMARSGRRVLLSGSVDGSAALHFEGLSGVGSGGMGARVYEDGRVRVLPNLDLRVVNAGAAGFDDGREESVIRQTGRASLPQEYDIEILDRVCAGEFGHGGDDCLLLVANPTAQCYRQLASSVETLETGSSSGQRTSRTYVINQHVPESYLSADILNLMNESFGVALFSDVLMVDELVRESAASGLPLSDYASSSASLQTIDRLAEHMCSSGSQSDAAA